MTIEHLIFNYSNYLSLKFFHSFLEIDSCSLLPFFNIVYLFYYEFSTVSLLEECYEAYIIRCNKRQHRSNNKEWFLRDSNTVSAKVLLPTPELFK